MSPLSRACQANQEEEVLSIDANRVSSLIKCREFVDDGKVLHPTSSSEISNKLLLNNKESMKVFVFLTIKFYYNCVCILTACNLARRAAALLLAEVVGTGEAASAEENFFAACFSFADAKRARKASTVLPAAGS